jgi:hypothetical protein
MSDITDFLFGKKTLKKAAAQGAPAPSTPSENQSYDYLKSQIAASAPQKKFVPSLQPTRKQLGAPEKDPATAELASPRTRRKK